MPTISLLIASALFAQESAVEENAEDSILEGKVSEMKSRAQSAQEQYRRELKDILEEKVELVQRIRTLELETRELRDQIDETRTESLAARDRGKELQSLIEEEESKNNFIERLLGEYLDNFETRLQIGEDQQYVEDLNQFRANLTAPGTDLLDKFNTYARVLELGLNRQESLIGGKRFHGRAINETGDVVEGQVAILGPTGYFLPDHDGRAGSLAFNPGTIEPLLVPANERRSARIANVFKTGEGLIPLDASLGQAHAYEEANITLGQHIRKGGVVGYFILTLGGIAFLIGLIKILDFRGYKVPSSAAINKMALDARAGRIDAAHEQANQFKGIMGEMLTAGVENHKADPSLLEDIMLSIILRNRSYMERFLSFIAITAAAAPLLGLLGTVVGMIKTFALITVFGTGDPKALSSGISEALITTELGLMVAIPALLIHAICTRIVRTRVSTMEQIAFDFVKLSTSQEELKMPGR